MTLDEVKSLVALMNDSSLSRLSIQQEGFSLHLERSITAAPAVSAPAHIVATPIAHAAAALPEPAAKEGDIIASPMVGTFYRSPSPDSPMFANVGDRVSKGKPLCILEAMKIFNEVEADFDCTILEILVEDGQVVEYDMPLFRVKRG